MKNPLLILMLFVSLFNSSCPLFDREDIKDYKSKEPVYTPKKVWETEVYFNSFRFEPFEAEGYGYYSEQFRSYGVIYYRLLKINLNNGEIIWRTKDVQTESISQAQKVGDNIYLPLHGKDIIMVYDDFDGSLAATASLKPETCSYKVEPIMQTAVYDKYIFWGNLGNNENYGLMRFDTSLIDLNKDPDDVQLIEPELIWQRNERSAVWTNIVVSNDGIVYFLTIRDTVKSGTVKDSYLVSLDAETKSPKWSITRNFGWGDRQNSLF